MIDEYTRRLQTELDDKIDMGDVYLERGKYQEAVNQYMSSLQSMSYLWILYNDNFKNSNYDARSKWQIATLVTLNRILFKILSGYMSYKPDRLKILFLLWVLKKSVHRLRDFNSDFDANSLEIYEQHQEALDERLSITSSGKNLEDLLERISELSSAKETVVEIDDGDGWFGIIRSDLYRICALEICPVDIPKPQSSNFWERRKDKLLEFVTPLGVASFLGVITFSFAIGWSGLGWLLTILAFLIIVCRSFI